MSADPGLWDIFSGEAQNKLQSIYRIIKVSAAKW